jgi:putative flippase GtrA
VVGAATNALGFAIYVLFTRLGVSPVLTISVFYPVHISSAFYFNKKWSFNHHGRLSTSAVRFLIAYVGCYLLNVIVLKFFNGYCGYSHLIVQAIAILVIAVLLFLTQKYWVFSVQVSESSSIRAL